MKQASKLIGLIALTLILASCSIDRLDGDWDDNIKLSTRIVHFDKNKNTATVKTRGSTWWINGVLVNGKDFITAQDQNIDPTQDSYTFKGEWFTVEKKNKTTLNINVDENGSETERKIIIHLQAGNYFDRVAITQKSK